jgi:hypothetical protein
MIWAWFSYSTRQDQYSHTENRGHWIVIGSVDDIRIGIYRMQAANVDVVKCVAEELHTMIIFESDCGKSDFCGQLVNDLRSSRSPGIQVAR